MSDSQDRSELITIAEASKRMGVDPKQIRRWAARLPLTDRTPEAVSPLRVSLEGLTRVRDGNRSESPQNDQSERNHVETVNHPPESHSGVGKEETDRAERGQDTGEEARLRVYEAQIEVKDEQLRELAARLEAAQAGEAELRRLLLMNTQLLEEAQGRLFLPSLFGSELLTETPEETPTKRPRWRFWKRG